MGGSSAYRINMIVACCENYVIGKDGQLPWKIPDDWKYFQRLTHGGTLILGRRCYEERGYAFPNRNTIVVSKTLRSLPDAQVARSVEEAIYMAQEKNILSNKERGFSATTSSKLKSSGNEVKVLDEKVIDSNKANEIWICGGSQVYFNATKFCSKLFFTRVHSSNIAGDTYFPASILTSFPRLISKKRGKDDKYDLTYFVYEKDKVSDS